MTMPEPENPRDKRVLQLKQTSTLTGTTTVSRIIIILPSTRYESYLKQKWVDVTDSLTPEEIAALPMPSIFDGA
jgi:hypothetical protein